MTPSSGSTPVPDPATRPPVDVMVLATHPDDAEIACGGTILGLVASGHSVALVDMTAGERSTRGTAEGRAAETAAATGLLGVAERRNLGLPDTAVRDDEVALRAVIGAIRALRPRIMLAPFVKDAHPDHEATGAVARRAFFHAGLRNVFPELGGPHRPKLLLHFFGNDGLTPSFCIDITAQVAKKRAVVECYASQIPPAGGAERAHLLRGLDLIERYEARDRWFGSICGVAAAEPFVVDGPLPLGGLGVLLS